MSLLLEALKKAEKAKEEARQRAEGAPSEPGLADDPVPGKGVMTRDQLPEIAAQPLEIAADELQLVPDPPSKPAGPARNEPGPREPASREPVRARAQPAPEARPAADPQAPDRAAGRKVFEAKFKEPNPRLPFYITMACLGVFAVGTVIYFYIQLRPPPPLVNANPPPPPPAEAVASASPPAASAAPRASADAPAQAAIPGLPPAPAAKGRLPEPPAQASRPAAPAQAPAQPPAPQAAHAAAREMPRFARAPSSEGIRPAPPAPRAAPRAPANEPTSAAPSAPAAAPSASRAPAVHPGVQAGYAAYVAGDLSLARREYELALRDEPANRDALLGTAALDVRAGRFEAAEAAYLRLLQADPRDAHAQAALIALRGGRLDPLVAESRVKSLLAADPGAHVLHFTLGNQLAQQGRWSEAQQHYFQAVAAEPENADFAYNLAVALDHLRQPRLALEHYRRAIDLAEKRGGSFAIGAARERAAQLAR